MSKNFQQSIKGVCGVILIALFVFSDQPSVYAKFVDINIQTFFLLKSIMLFVVYGLFVVSLVLVARSHNRILKLIILVLVSISSVYADVFYYASGKVMEYIDFVILYQSKANVLDALVMYSDEIMASLLRLCALWGGFLIMPKRADSKSHIIGRILSGGGGGDIITPFSCFCYACLHIPTRCSDKQASKSAKPTSFIFGLCL